MARDWSGLYLKAHTLQWWPEYLRGVIRLHLEPDKWTHKPEGGWNWKGYALEVLTWVLVAWWML